MKREERRRDEKRERDRRSRGLFRIKNTMRNGNQLSNHVGTILNRELYKEKQTGRKKKDINKLEIDKRNIFVRFSGC